MLRVGVIGLGYWGPNLARNASKLDRTELVYLSDRDRERLDAIGALYPGCERVTDAAEVFASPDVDAVMIATPTATHFELAKAALEAGKHVVVEKPFVETVGEAEHLIALAERQGVLLMVDHVYLYNPAVVCLSQLVRDGRLGEVHFIDSVRINLGLFQHDVNVIWDLAPHDLSILDHLLGRMPRAVTAVGASHNARDIADVAHLHLDYGDGLIASVHVNWLSPVKIRHFMIGGDRSSVLYNDLDSSEPIKIYDRGIEFEADPDGSRMPFAIYRSGDVLSPRVPPTEALTDMLRHFVDCVETGQEPRSSARQGLRMVRILTAADESLQKLGTRIEIE